MKNPALRFLLLLIGFGLIAVPAVQAQEPPTADHSSEEAHKKKVIGKPQPVPITFKPTAAGKQDKANPEANRNRAKKAEASKPKSVPENDSKKFVAAKESAKKPVPKIPPSVLILVEWIEVEHEDFSDWVFENKLTTDATELRKQVQKWIKEEDAEILRTSIVHARSGQRAKVESIREVIYPSEYDPPETSNEPHLSDNAVAPVIPATGSAYETRNVGTTVEVDPILSEDGKFIDLNLSPEMVYRLEDLEWVTESNGETQAVLQPQFYAVKATTQVTVRNGGYALIGTLQLPELEDDDDDDDDDDEIVLLFVRADAE